MLTLPANRLTRTLVFTLSFCCLSLQVGRARTTGLNWVEDLEWTRQLDVGWDLSVLRKQGKALMGQFGASGQLSVSGGAWGGVGGMI